MAAVSARLQSTSAAPPAPAGPLAADRRESRFRLAASYLLTFCWFLVFLGLAWDVQFHMDVGPDSFTTLPHGLMYGGTALAGLNCLYVVLATTGKYRRGAEGVTDATVTPWLGLFRAPVGFIIGGLGVTGFLLAGAFDSYWHNLYGFDPIFWTPPHVMLNLSAIVSLVGALYAMASEAGRAAARGEAGLFHPARLGLILAAAVFLAVGGSVFLGEAVGSRPAVGPVNTYGLFSALLFPPVLLAAAAAVRRPGAATLTALIYTLFRLTAWFGAPWATRLLAGSLNLPYKADAWFIPWTAFQMPAYLLVTGLSVDLALALLPRLRLGERAVSGLAGALAAISIYLLNQPWRAVLAEPFFARNPEVLAEFTEAYTAVGVTTPPAVLLLGALTGWLGWNLGLALRHTDR